jgi:drug/metabolite transporter (DMT)-like permease
MLPIALKSLHLITRENRTAIAVMTLAAGVPYLFLCNLGFASAPAAHGILTPSTMPLWVGIGAYFILKEKITNIRLLGYLFILSGAIFKIGFAEGGFSSVDLFFLGASLCYGVYTILTKIHSNLPPIALVAFVSSGNMILLAIPYTIYQIINPHELPLVITIQQIIYQGIFTGIIALIAYNKAIQLIGAARTSSFAALAPVMVTLLAVPLLGETPTQNDWIFVALMTIGVFLASGVIKK